MKKLLSLLLSVFLVFTLAAGVNAQQPLSSKNDNNRVNVSGSEVSLTFNGVEVSSKSYKLYEVDKQVYLPLRETFDLLNFTVHWDSKKRAMIAKKFGDTFTFTANGLSFYYIDSEVELSTSPINIDQKLYMSSEQLESILSIEVEWNKSNKSLAVTYEPSKGYFWKIENGENVVYYLGSIHYGSDVLYPIRDEVEGAFYNSDYLVLEVDYFKELTEAELIKAEQLQTIQGDKTLKDLISADTYSKFQQLLTNLELPTDLYDKIQPWVIQLELTTLVAQTGGYVGSQGIDLYFANKAVRQQKSIEQLESALLQYEVLSNFSDEYNEKQINLLLDAILDGAEASDTAFDSSNPIDPLIEIWKYGNDEALVQYLENLKKSDSEQYEVMLLGRHDNMVNKIDGYLNNKNGDTYFVITGYAHSLGEDGLVKLLKDKGYKVTRL